VRVFGVTETDGTWDTAVGVPLPAGIGTANVNVNSISCPSAGNCAMGGPPGFLADETRGSWTKATTVPGLLARPTADVVVTSVSCRSPGNCSAAGTYRSGAGQQVFVVGEAGGTWEMAQQVPGTASLNAGRAASVTALSCGAPATCSAGGYYTDRHGVRQAFLVSASRTSLALSAARVTDGHEQAELLTVTVSPLHAGMPTGSVTVKTGGTVICVARLSSGKGSCRLTAEFKPGTHRLFADYGGSADFDPSVSAAKTLTVVK
jgi:Bacterial Ig-like domain (group 3)